MENECLGCQRLEEGAEVVTLVSGAVVCTWCPSWQHECAERHRKALRVLELASRDDRLRYVADYRAANGDLAADRLETEVRRVYAVRRGD